MPDPVKCRQCEGAATLKGDSPLLCRPCGDRLASLCQRVNGGLSPSKRGRISARYETSSRAGRRRKNPSTGSDYG